jgi:hypothetical protein
VLSVASLYYLPQGAEAKGCALRSQAQSSNNNKTIKTKVITSLQLVHFLVSLPYSTFLT